MENDKIISMGTIIEGCAPLSGFPTEKKKSSGCSLKILTYLLHTISSM